MRRRLNKKLARWCWYCGDQLTKRTQSKDHQLPLSRGGRGGINKVDCCKKCNNEKGDLTVDEFRWKRFASVTKLFHGEEVEEVIGMGGRRSYY
jgi:5-methylcytosine-specific restriction endonuclease McrA